MVSRVEKESVLVVAFWFYRSLICARLNVAFNYDLVELSQKNERKFSHLSHCDLNFSSWKSAGCNEVTHEFLGAEFSPFCMCMLVLC